MSARLFPAQQSRPWADRFESDDSYRLTRGVQFGSATGIQTVRYSNGDILWICSASAGAAITPLFPSATKNSGAAMIVLARSAGNVVVSAAGGTLHGSATVSASLGSRTWRSDGSAWWPIGETRAAGGGTTTTLARLITGEGQIVPEHRALVRELRPLIEGSSATAIEARVGKRDRLVDSVSFGAASALNSLGLCPVRANARYHRFRFDISGGFDHAIGFDVRFTKEGRR